MQSEKKISQSNQLKIQNKYREILKKGALLVDIYHDRKDTAHSA
jgi:hypothetical protein